jgi:hypothetical protein
MGAKEAQEGLALGCADPAPDVLEGSHLGPEQRRLPTPDFAQDLVDQVLLAGES